MPVRISTCLLALVALCAVATTVRAQSSTDGFHNASATISAGGAWTVTIPERNWHFTGTTGRGLFTSRVDTGSDQLGAYRELIFRYPTTGGDRTSGIRIYTARPVVLFSSQNDTEAPNIAPFPVIHSYPQLQHLSFIGMFAQEDFVNLAPNGVSAFFDAAGNTFAISAAKNFMTAETKRNQSDEMIGGISSSIPTLAAGFRHETILLWGQGINKTLDAWGSALTEKGGKVRSGNDNGVLLNKLSYWTDNGATYYYNPGDLPYTETLKTIRNELKDKGVRLGSMQLDSWWYPKGPDNSWFSRSGIWTYTAAPNIFQSELSGFHNDLGLPLVTHARWIDEASPYRSKYAISGNVATDPKYWDSVATYLKAGGGTTYEQDWLGLSAHTDFNLAAPEAFLDNMAASMASHGLTIQYCMAEPTHFLQSTKYSNVTTIRTSQDRFGRERWTHFLYSSRLATSVGAWPFSDVFMSSEMENLLVATLSAGPVGIGDRVGSINADNLLRAVRADGVIVKPDTALAPTDATILADSAGTDVPMQASAQTDFAGGIRATYLLAYPRGANTVLTIAPAAYGIPGAAWLYDGLTHEGRLLGANSSWTTNLGGGIGFYTLTAVGASGLALAGDHDQFVSLGKKRFASALDKGALDITLTFAAGETVRTITGYSPSDIAVTAVSGRISSPTWTASNSTFTVNVRPDPITKQAHLRLTTAEAADPTSRVPGCTVRCLLDR